MMFSGSIQRWILKSWIIEKFRSKLWEMDVVSGNVVQMIQSNAAIFGLINNYF